MGTNNVIFLEVIEWFDQTGDTMVHRIPETGSGEIKYGAQLVLRESQAGVFFYNGHAIHVFGPGRHTLETGNIPILNKIMAIPWGLKSPLRAEVYLLNMKTFTNNKWGTKDPVAFKDSQLGLIRLRANGLYTVRIVQPLLLINSLVGTVGELSAADVDDYLSSVIVSRFNDYLGEHLDTMMNLPGKYDEVAGGLKQLLQQDFAHFGLDLPYLYINSITPPLEVQKAIDDRSKLGIFKDLNDLMRLKSAMAIEKAAENPTGGRGSPWEWGFLCLPCCRSSSSKRPMFRKPRNALAAEKKYLLKPSSACSAAISWLCFHSARHAATTSLLTPNSARDAAGRRQVRRRKNDADTADTRTFTMLPSATSAVSGSNALLEHQCPQCGAGVSLAETDRIFSCPFCRVRLYIAGDTLFSYYLVPAVKNTDAAFFSHPTGVCGEHAIH